ncbi:MAG: hypothetical protein IT200_16245 [Thermoleophilia bacterium]|nr:hypothetical protein [Thermoleophilia bacterium]
MADDDRYGNEGDTGRKPIPRPDREFEDLDDSFSERGSTFFQEYAEQYEEPAAARPEPEDFGFDDIAVGDDEPEPGSARDRARSRARGRAGGRGGRAGAAAGRLSARARGSVARTRGGGGGGRGGGRRPASSGGGGLSANSPLVRMGGIALFVILLVVVLAFVIKDCRHDALVDSYKQYVNSAAQISEDSATQGQKLLVVMQNSKGEDAAALQRQVRSLANQADELRDRAEGLSAPGKLGDADNALLLSLRYRANGLRELEKFLPQIIQQSDETAAARTIKGSMQRFLASDVIMRDSFIDPTSAALRDEDITSIQGPDRAASAFLRGANDRFASDAGAKQLVQPLKRQKGTGTGNNSSSTGNLRGTRLVSVVAEPSGTQLSTSGATVTQSSEFQWRITILNGGNFVESGIKVTVTLTYPSSNTPVDSQEATITTISPDKEASVSIPGPPQDAVQLGQKGELQVSVAPVKGEQNTGNNSATYPVTITFG